MGQIIGHCELFTDRRIRWPFGKVHEVKRSSVARRTARPGSSGSGFSAEIRCAPFVPDHEVRVTVPSGATSESRTNQRASGASAATFSTTRGMPRISSSLSSGGES